MRFILILIALAVIVMILKRLWQKPGPEKPNRVLSNKMVQCARCGLYTPEQDAITHDGKTYCSQAHLDEDS